MGFDLRLHDIVYKMHFLCKSKNDRKEDGFTTFIILVFLFFPLIYLRIVLTNGFLFIINLYLVPQILRIAKREQLNTMNKVFIFGIMVPRSIFILYVKGCPYNIFEFSPNYSLILLILSSIFVQVILFFC